MRKNSGFTLIELLVVIGIIGILATVVLASINSARDRSRDTRRVADLRQMVIALQLYYEANGYYPSSSCGWDCNGYSFSNDSTSWGALQTALSPYIPSLPVDPKNTGSAPWNAGEYVYAYGNVGRTTYTAQYDLTAQLETNSNLRCSVKQYTWYFTNLAWCGSYSGQIYEASPNF